MWGMASMWARGSTSGKAFPASVIWDMVTRCRSSCFVGTFSDRVQRAFPAIAVIATRTTCFQIPHHDDQNNNSIAVLLDNMMMCDAGCLV